MRGLKLKALIGFYRNPTNCHFFAKNVYISDRDNMLNKIKSPVVNGELEIDPAKALKTDMTVM